MVGFVLVTILNSVFWGALLFYQIKPADQKALHQIQRLTIESGPSADDIEIATCFGNLLPSYLSVTIAKDDDPTSRLRRDKAASGDRQPANANLGSEAIVTIKGNLAAGLVSWDFHALDRAAYGRGNVTKGALLWHGETTGPNGACPLAAAAIQQIGQALGKL